MAVVDNNILSALAKVDHLSILAELFPSIVTPIDVERELRDERVAGFSFVDRIRSVYTYEKPERSRWLVVMDLTPEQRRLADGLLDRGLAPADGACLALAETRAEPLVTDDRWLAQVAQDRGVEPMDLEAILTAAVEQGHIHGAKAIERILEGLEELDFYVFSDGFRQAIHNAADTT